MKKGIGLVLFLFSFGLMAQERHPIDQAAREKLRTAVNTAEMVNPSEEARAQWDQLMNIVYQELKATASPDFFNSIQESQRAWLSYRDSRIRAINHLYYGEMQGTMWYPVAAGKRKEVIRERTRELLDIYDMLNDPFSEEEWNMIGKWEVTEGMTIGANVEIRDDFTAVWRYPGKEGTEFQFYTHRPCSDGTEGDFITLVKADKPEEKQCYLVKKADRYALVLEAEATGKQVVFKRSL